MAQVPILQASRLAFTPANGATVENSIRRHTHCKALT
jgi:hypothetical protein